MVHRPLAINFFFRAETQKTIFTDSCNDNVLGADDPNDFHKHVDKDQGIDICNKFTEISMCN